MSLLACEMLAFITQSCLSFSLKSIDTKVFKKNGFLTENFYCKCFYCLLLFFCLRRPLDTGPKYQIGFVSSLSWEKVLIILSSVDVLFSNSNPPSNPVTDFN